MDDAGETEKLEQARARLTDHQRIVLAYYCEVRLRAESAYAPKHELSLANVLYEGRRGHQQADLEEVVTRAVNEASVRDAKEKHAADLTAVKEPELQQPPQEPPEITPRPEQEFGTPLWKVQASTPDRQRHQPGLYGLSGELSLNGSAGSSPQPPDNEGPVPPDSPSQTSSASTEEPIDGEARRSLGLMADFVTVETKAQAALDHANQNNRDGHDL